MEPMARHVFAGALHAGRPNPRGRRRGWSSPRRYALTYQNMLFCRVLL